MEWGELLGNLNLYKLLFSLKRFPSLPQKNIYILTNLASQCIPWQAFLRSRHRNWRENTNHRKFLHVGTWCLSLKFVACFCSRGDEGTFLGSVLTDLQAGSRCSLCCHGRGSGPFAPVRGHLGKVEIWGHGKKLTKREIYKNKVQKVTSRKHYGLSREKEECNNIATVPNTQTRSQSVVPLRK